MPGSHRHFHRRRDLFDDIGDLFGGHDPRKNGDSKDNSGNSDSTPTQDDSGKQAQSTAVHIVYKTMSPTFSGAIGGYSTVNKPSASPTVAAPPPPPPSPTSTSAKQSDKATSSDTNRDLTKSSKSSNSTPTAIHSTSQSISDTVLAKATGSPTASASGGLNENNLLTSGSSSLASATDSADSASSTGSSSPDSGLSGGAKAGIAIGVIGGLLMVGLVIFLLLKRRNRNGDHQELIDNEKFEVAPTGGAMGGAKAGAMSGAAGGFVGGGVVAAAAVERPLPSPSPSLSPSPSPEPIDETPVRSNPNAPRISLRPVTQFLPNWNLDKRNSKGATAALAVGAVGATSLAVTNEHSDRPNTSQSDHPANPFGSEAERVASPSRTPSPPASPDGPLVDKAMVAGAVVGAVAAAGTTTLARKASMKNQRQNVDLTVNTAFGPVPPSPAGTEYSMSSSPGPGVGPSQSAAAIAAAGGPLNSTVHRVQLDFKPSLDDELELKAGDLVRLLHEYDDGWALCIRLDRSKQGVVPRTCLSTRAVKPRSPQGRPPVNPAGPPRGFQPGPGQQRPMTSQSQRPMTPQSQRPMTPQTQRPMTSQSQRPMTPQSQRPMTPQGMYVDGAPRAGPGPGSRPASPAPRVILPYHPDRPLSPMSAPASAQMGPAGRPMSPGAQFQGPPASRPQSPAGRPASPAANAQGLPTSRPASPLSSVSGSPPGSSPLNPAHSSPPGPPTGPIGRKPVPGQAY